MRVCIVNYRYFVSSGPERYMFAITELLERAGHEVVPFSVRYAQNEPSPWEGYFVDPIAGEREVYFRQHSWTPRAVRKSLERAFYSREVYDSLSRLVRDERPDVALVLKFQRKLSPSVLTALRDGAVPIVVRLSDFGMVCPEQHLTRDGHICEDCVGARLYWPSVRYRCVQGSLAASAVDALALTHARSRGYFDAIDRFIAPSSVMREKMIAGGFAAGRIVRLPSFATLDAHAGSGQRARRICFVGRIEPIKGVDVLIDGFAELVRRPGFQDVELVIIGDDATPEAERVKRRAEDRRVANVVFRGVGDAAAVTRVLSTSALSVVPSICHENLPLALLESLSCGTPVVGSDVRSIAEVLEGTGAGSLFRSGDAGDLARVLGTLLRDPSRLAAMRQAARHLAVECYSPQTHLTGLVRLFDEVVTERAAVAR